VVHVSTAGSAPRCTPRSRLVVHLSRLHCLRATLDGKRLRIRRGRRPTVVVDLRRSGARPVTLVVGGRNARGYCVRIRKTYRGC
jgi:hypothetical protein